MAKITIDMSGRGGLTVDHEKEQPNTLYLSQNGELAGGEWNPFTNFGYLSPPNNTVTPCTGTIGARITSSVYDSVSDDLYFGTDGETLLRIDGLADTSVVTDTTIDADRSIKDMELYEIAGGRALIYVTDSSDTGDGMSLGLKSLDDDAGLRQLSLDVVNGTTDITYEVIGNGDDNEILAQRFYRDDVLYYGGKIESVRVLLSRYGSGTGYTVKVGIQASDSSGNPDGTYLGSGTVDPATIDNTIESNTNGEDIYVTLDTAVTPDYSKPYWIVVEPTDITDMTGTNSFAWYRSGNNEGIYAYGIAYASDGTTWATVNSDDNIETFDCSLILRDTDTLYPRAGKSSTHGFEELDTDVIASGSNGFGDVHVMKYDETHIVVAWNGADDDGFVRMFSYDADTGHVTPMGTVLEFDTVAGEGIRIDSIDATHFILVWEGGNDIEAQCFAVDTSYVITAVGTPTTVVSNSTVPNIATISASNAVITYTDVGTLDGFSKLLAIDGSYNVTATAATFEYEDDITGGVRASIIKIDATHVMVTWQGTGADGFMRVLAIDTGTPAITAAGAELEFDTVSTYTFDTMLLDSSTFLLAYRGSASTSNINVQVYTLDGSYTITASGTGAVVTTAAGASSTNQVSIANIIQDRYAVVYSDTNSDGFIRGLYIDESNNVILNTVEYEFDETYAGGAVSLGMGDNNVVVFSDNGVDTGDFHSLHYAPLADTDTFYVEEGQDTFLRKADNGFLYWFTNTDIHSFDGSLTGGNIGTFNKSIIRFPSYIRMVDAVDTRGFMYIAIHSNVDATGSSDTRLFNSSTAGVYVWDRQSTIVRTRDFYPLYGVREIKRMFLSYNGDVMLFCINNKKETELRRLSNGRFLVVKKLNSAGYPPYRSSISYLDNMFTWQAADGKMYAYGQVQHTEKEALFALGDISVQAAGAYTPGVAVLGNSTGDMGMYVSWADGSTQKLSRWHVDGSGTLDSVVQKPGLGSVYSPVKLIPPLTTLNYINLYHLPIATNDATEVGTLKIYFNQSTTPWASKTITKKDLHKGVKYIQVGLPFINSVQLEVEWAVAETIGTDSWRPMLAEIDVTPTKAINR